MKVRWLGHSCIEILGKHHILFDPDYQREPLPNVEYIFITHGHEDHLGKVAEIQAGAVFAAKDVCVIASDQGVPVQRLFAVEPGDVVDNVRVLVGYSSMGLLSELWARLWGRRHEFPGGTPLSFLVEDDLSLLHIGDGVRAPEGVNPDVLCLPYRRVPFWNERFERMLINLVEELGPRYVIPIHHDILPWGADPEDLQGRLNSELVIPVGWVELPKSPCKL